MRSPSSTTRSDPSTAWAVAAILLASVILCGCATESVSPGKVPEPAMAAPGADRPEPKPPVLGLEYGNRSTRATLQLDLGNEDVQVQMTGSPARRDTLQSESVIHAASHARPVPLAPDDSGAAQARRIVDSTSNRRLQPSVPDSVTSQVVGAIRKAQEAFYKARYQEAFEQAQRSISYHPTPEGCALAGSAAWVLKDRESARRYWMQARTLDPDFPGVAAMLESMPPRLEAAP